MTWTPTTVTRTDWGRLQVVIDGTDVTWIRDVPVQIQSWDNAEPFGDASCVLEFPQITPFEAWSGAFSWIRGGALVDITLIRTDNSHKLIWTGWLRSPETEADEQQGHVELHCVGILLQGDEGVQQPSFHYEARDIGTVIAETFNTYPSRDYATCAAVVTGITTRSRGSWTPRITGHVQDLLGTATVRDGSNQWTVKQSGKTPVIALKDITTTHATVTVASPGVTVSLASDFGGAPNVIYGEGISPDHRRWRNTKYPNLHPDETPVYPLSPSNTFTPGGSDTGFQDFSDFMREHGYPWFESEDTYDADDENEVRDAQKRAGILVDGIVGPQTWATILGTGSNAGDLNGAFFAPLAFDKRVEPFIYNVRGEILGDNPDFDPTILRVERYENFGENITKHDAILSARAELARVEDPGIQGTVTLRIDPEEISRFELRAGMNLNLKSYRGANHLLHIAGVSVDWPGQSVTLTVDDKARDLMTLGAIRARNVDAATDPVRRNLPMRRRSRQAQDDIVIFDAESGAGIIPKHALYGGLWTVIRIPAGQLGEISKTTFTTWDSASKFAVGVFAAPITSNHMVSLVGNPLSGTKPWSVEADALVDAGIMVAWGGPGQAMGYYPNAESDDPTPTLTGRFEDSATWFYESTIPPWLWVAEYALNSCFIKGRMYGGQDF